MYSPLGPTTSKKHLLGSDFSTEPVIDEEHVGRKARDDFNEPSKKSLLLVGDETTTASEQSSIIMSDSDIESTLDHGQAKEKRDKVITRTFGLLFLTMAVARTD